MERWEEKGKKDLPRKIRKRRNGKGIPGCGMMKHGPRVATHVKLSKSS